MTISLRPISLGIAVASLVCALFPSLASARHSWGKYHWNNPKHPSKLELTVGNNLTGVWGGSFLGSAAITPWNRGCAGDLNGTPDACLGDQPSGSAGTIASRVSLNPDSGLTTPATCSPVTGRVEVCNYGYGDTGWLGIAQIWINSQNHIVQGVAKLNDTYFNEPPYNTDDWRQLVICQEVGHTFGLDHQDERFRNTNLGTCMDYTRVPLGPPANTAPNYHDFEQLVTIYGHSDTSGGGGAGKGGGRGAGIPPATYDKLNDRAQWGVLKRETNNGRTAIYERDLADGYKLVTFVIWAK